MIEDWI